MPAPEPWVFEAPCSCLGPAAARHLLLPSLLLCPSYLLQPSPLPSFRFLSPPSPLFSSFSPSFPLLPSSCLFVPLFSPFSPFLFPTLRSQSSLLVWELVVCGLSVLRLFPGFYCRFLLSYFPLFSTCSISLSPLFKPKPPSSSISFLYHPLS